MTIVLHPQNFALRSSGGLLDSRATDPPSFTTAPTTASLPATGGTIQFSAQNAASYSLTVTRTGITIDPSTGLVTVTAAAAGTTGSITVHALGSTGLTADASCTVTVAAVVNNSLNFPRLGMYWIGNNYSLGGKAQQYQSPGGIALMARRHVVIMGPWPELSSWRGVSNQAIAAAVKAASTVGTKLYLYADVEAVEKTGTAFVTAQAKVAAENWYLYASGASGTKLDSYFANTMYAVNTTAYVPLDASGRIWCQWIADYAPSWMFNGAEGNAVAPDIEGMYWDNALFQPRVSGDWNRAGGTDAAATAAPWIRAGIVTGATRYRAANPTRTQLANFADFYNFSSFPFPEYHLAWDGGVIEHIMGHTWSAEYFLSTAEFVQKTNWIIATARDEKLVLFNCCPMDLSATNYQDFRHAYTCCLVVTNTCFDYTTDTLALGIWPDYDEYAFNLGTEVTGKQTAAASNGIWRRDFTNGIALWCPKGVTGTIALGGTFYVLRGNAAAGRTPGAAVTSVTFSSARDGLILSRTPT